MDHRHFYLPGPSLSYDYENDASGHMPATGEWQHTNQGSSNACACGSHGHRRNLAAGVPRTPARMQLQLQHRLGHSQQHQQQCAAALARSTTP